MGPNALLKLNHDARAFTPIASSLVSHILIQNPSHFFPNFLLKGDGKCLSFLAVLTSILVSKVVRESGPEIGVQTARKNGLVWVRLGIESQLADLLRVAAEAKGLGTLTAMFGISGREIPISQSLSCVEVQRRLKIGMSRTYSTNEADERHNRVIGKSESSWYRWIVVLIKQSARFFVDLTIRAEDFGEFEKLR